MAVPPVVIDHTGPTYSRIPSAPDSNITAAQDARSNAESAALAPPDLSTIRATELAGARDRVTSIQQRYDQGAKDFADSENEASQKRSAGLRAMAASTGLTGSPTAFSQANDNANQTRRTIKQNTDQQNAVAQDKIDSIYSEVDANAKALYESAKADNKDARDAILKRASDSATSQIKALGETLGTQHTFDEQLAQDPELFKKLSEQSGLSEYEMRQMFEAAVPEEFRPKTKEIVTTGPNGNAVIQRITFNPVKGTMDHVGNYDTGIPYAQYDPNNVIKGSDGQLLVPDPDNPGMYKRINPLSEKEQLEIQKLRNEAGGGTNDATAQAYLKGVQTGQYKISDIPKEYQNAVAVGLSSDTAPVSELKQNALKSVTDLITKFDSGAGTSAVGKSGFLNSLGYGLIPGTKRSDFVTQFDNLKSLLSLDNVKLLKGQGQVSDAERRLLADASAKLELSQSEPEFRAALKDIQDALHGNGDTSAETDDQAIERMIRENPNITDTEIEQQLNQKKNSPVSVSIPQTSHLAFVNRNPLNLRFAGQTGASQGEGGFARFETAAAGVAAGLKQIAIDAERGHTLSSFISKFAPPSENDTNTYIKQVANALGVTASTPLTKIDQKALLKAMAKKESSTVIA